MPNRRTRYLQWCPDRLLPLEEENPVYGVFKPPRARAIYLLRILAEVEHSLMAQYLFAAWSLGRRQSDHSQHGRLIRSWKSTILAIAREEMGHLATVQNLITLIGGPVSFAREDYPAKSELYPFAFELEPLTKCSLGKYVLAEMPSDEIVVQLVENNLLRKGEIDEIKDRVRAETLLTVHRVGRLYEMLKMLFQAPEPGASLPNSPVSRFIQAADIQADSIGYQVLPGEWGLGDKDLLILSASSRGDALKAIDQISQQGEGSNITENFMHSHFGRFLAIYRAFPGEDEGVSLPLAHNPTIDPTNKMGSRIKNEEACVWAHLFNVRYRMLLMYLIHSFAIEAHTSQSERSAKGLLISFAFGEMYHLRSIGEILMTLPLDGYGSGLAGPPFEMPDTLEMPLREPDRWRLHRDLILASQHYADKLLGFPGSESHKTYLAGMHTTNSSALAQAIALAGA